MVVAPTPGGAGPEHTLGGQRQPWLGLPLSKGLLRSAPACSVWSLAASVLGAAPPGSGLTRAVHASCPAAPAGACSSAVAALLSLLAPFPYSLDWRPYFTIHDPAFARLAAGDLPTAANGLPVLLGVTNLYFLKVGSTGPTLLLCLLRPAAHWLDPAARGHPVRPAARALIPPGLTATCATGARPLQALPNWPNVLATGHTATTAQPSSSSGGADGLARLTNGGSLHPSESAPSMVGSSIGGGISSSSSGLAASSGRLGSAAASSSTSRLGSMLRRRPASPAALLSGPVDQCWLAYKPLSRPDKTVLDRLVHPQQAGGLPMWQAPLPFLHGCLPARRGASPQVS